MIVVLGRPELGPPAEGGDRSVAGLAAAVAIEVTRAGGRVELVGTVGGDTAGDDVAVLLGAAGVGHAALSRDPAGVTPGGRGAGPRPRLDAADVQLGLSYLPECRAIVVADDLDEAASAQVMEAAGYHGAPVVAIASPGTVVPEAWDRGATVLLAPDPDDEDGPVDLAPFARLVAGFAAGLAAGHPPGEALTRAASGGGWERAADA